MSWACWRSHLHLVSLGLGRCRGQFGTANLEQSRERALENGRLIFQSMGNPVPFETLRIQYLWSCVQKRMTNGFCLHSSLYPNQYLESFDFLSLPSLIQHCLFLYFYFLWSCWFWFLVNELCGVKRVKGTSSQPQKNKRMFDICCSLKLGGSVPSFLAWWLNTVQEVEICLLALQNFPLQFTLENVGG